MNDLLNGSVELYLQANSLNCPSDKDTIVLTIPPELKIAVGKKTPFFISSNTIIEVKFEVADRTHLGDLSYYAVYEKSGHKVFKKSEIDKHIFDDRLNIDGIDWYINKDK